MRKLLLISIGFVLAVLLSGCDVYVWPERESGDALSFSASQGALTRATSPVQPDASDYLISPGREIAVFGTITRSGKDDYTLFNKQVVTCGQDLEWTYAPLKYWKRSGVYDFKAVCPYGTITLAGTSGKRLLVNHSITANHLDLLVASAQRDAATGNTSPVNLRFRHACAAVRFLFKKGSEDYDYSLSSFRLENLRIVGTLDMTADTVTFENWHTSGMASATEVFAWSAATAADRKDIPVSYDAYTGAQWYYMIPQTMAVPAGTARPSVTFSVIFNGEPTPVTTTLPLPASYTEGGQTVEARWEPGRVYTYYINLRPSTVAITVHVTPWDEETLVVDDIIFD